MAMREKEAHHLEACASLSKTMANCPSTERTVNDRSSMLCITEIHSMMKKILLILKFIVKFFTFFDHKKKLMTMSSSGKQKREAVKILSCSRKLSKISVLFLLMAKIIVQCISGTTDFGFI